MKQNRIMKFVSETFGSVRGLYLDGQAWVYATDVCKALGLKDVTSALRALDADEKMTIGINDSQKKNDPAQSAESKKRGGARMYNLINEAGLFRLIFVSRKPNAREFQRWVFHDVLPTLRREGEYRLTWYDARNGGKITRRTLTDTIKAFCEYLKERNELDRPEGIWYQIFTNLVNKKLSITDKRNNLTAKQLFELDTCEHICAKEIESGMAAGKGHHDTYKACEEKLTAWRELTA